MVSMRRSAGGSFERPPRGGHRNIVMESQCAGAREGRSNHVEYQGAERGFRSQCAGAREGRSNYKSTIKVDRKGRVSMRRSAGGSFEQELSLL